MTKELTGEYNKAEKLSAEDAKRVFDAGRRDWHTFEVDRNKMISVDTRDPNVKINVPADSGAQAICMSEAEIITVLGQNYEARLKASELKFDVQHIPVINDFSDRSEVSTFRKTVSIDSGQLADIGHGVSGSSITLEQAQEILDNGFQTSEMSSDVFSITKEDARRVLGDNYGTLLIESASSFKTEGDNVTLDIESIQKIAKFKLGAVKHTGNEPA